MLRSLLLFAFCVGLAAASLSKKKATKRIVKRDTAECNCFEFTCDNGYCIEGERTCDTDDDCGDGSDENLSWCPPLGNCTSPHMVKCDNGGCLPIDYRCDGDNDCGDNTDERDCEYFECLGGEFECDNGICIDSEWYCDGYDDCGDNSDEPAYCSLRD